MMDTPKFVTVRIPREGRDTILLDVYRPASDARTCTDMPLCLSVNAHPLTTSLWMSSRTMRQIAAALVAQADAYDAEREAERIVVDAAA